MPKMSRQQQIDTEGSRVFEALLPSGWAVARQHPDFAVDYLISIFDDNGIATGLQFYVQLKSSESINSDDHASIQLKLDHFDYWQRLGLPTLLVVVDVTTGHAWCEWVRTLDPHPRLPGQSTKVFHLASHQRWQPGQADSIVGFVVCWRAFRDGPLAWPLGLRVEALNDPANRDLIVDLVRTPLSGLGHLLELHHDIRTPTDVVVRISEGQIRAMTCAAAHAVFDLSPASDLDGLSAGDVLYLIAVALANAEQPGPAAEVMAEAVRTFTGWDDPQACGHVAAVLIVAGRSELVQACIETLRRHDGDDDDAINALLSQLVILEGYDETQPLRTYIYELLRELYDRNLTTNPSRAQSAAYTLANMTRGPGRANEESLTWHDRLAELNPVCRDQAWWHRERGSAYFLLERSDEALAAFQRAHELGDDDVHFPFQYADALFGTGQFDRAAEVLQPATQLPYSMGADARVRTRAAQAFASDVFSRYQPPDTMSHVRDFSAFFPWVIDQNVPVDAVLGLAFWELDCIELWGLALWLALPIDDDLAKDLAATIRALELPAAIDITSWIAANANESSAGATARRHYDDAIVVQRAPVERPFG